MEAVLNKDLHTELRKLLECPVCYTHLSPPIMMCRNGHNLCNDCIPKMSECPLCKADKPLFRNLFAEATCGIVFVECKYQKYGCKKSFHLDNYGHHLAKCKYRFDCRVRYSDESQKCEWVGDSKEALKQHVLTSHNGHYLNSFIAEISCKIEKSRPLFFARLVSAFHELFWVCIQYYPDSKALDFYTTYVGSHMNAHSFKYRFDITLSGAQRTTTIGSKCRYLHRKQASKRYSLMLQNEMFQDLTKKGEIECQMRIINKENKSNGDTNDVNTLL